MTQNNLTYFSVEVWATSNDTDISVTVIPVKQSTEMALRPIVVSLYTAEGQISPAAQTFFEQG
jgi:hypothetical protein